MSESFGWTTDHAILAIVEDIGLTGDDITTNRKVGGVHRVWAWPLGHPDEEDFNGADLPSEPIFVRADIAYGRYLQDGCTFLVWDYHDGGETVRAGTLADAEWLQRGVGGETARQCASAARAQQVAQRRAEKGPGYDFAAHLPGRSS